MKADKNWTIMMAIIGLATLITFVIGAAFAFFAVINDSTSSTTILGSTDIETYAFSSMKDGEISFNLANVVEPSNTLEPALIDTAEFDITLSSSQDGLQWDCDFDINYTWSNLTIPVDKDDPDNGTRQSDRYTNTSKGVTLPYTDPNTNDVYNFQYSIQIYEQSTNNEKNYIKMANANEIIGEVDLSEFFEDDSVDSAVIAHGSIQTATVVGSTKKYIVEARIYSLPFFQHDFINKFYSGYISVSNVVCGEPTRLN